MAAEFCLEIFKVIRGFGGAAISATQDLSDFFGLEDGKYGRAIINNSNNNKVPVVVKASKLEKEMITTDRAELEAILKERQREKTHSA